MGEVGTSTKVTFVPDAGEARAVALGEGETVLEGLLRGGVPVPNCCRAGACQSCLLQATTGTPPPASQKGLKDAYRARGLFLSCVCKPAGDLTVRFAADVGRRVAAEVRGVERIGRDVARVSLACAESFDYFPGQFVNVARPDGLTRSYSLASLHSPPGLPLGDDLLELHVRKIAGGRMSTWLHDEARPGDRLDVSSPLGDCFYVPGRPDQPLLLVGTGTGLAPLYAIVRDALRHGHAGPIRLYHGALRPEGLYFGEKLADLAARHPNFGYAACVLNGPPVNGERVGDLADLVLADLPKPAGWRVFLCGDPSLVGTLKKKIYLAGARMKDIHADAFLLCPVG